MSDTHSWKYKQVKEWMQTAAKYGHTRSSLDSIVHAINDVFASNGRQMAVKIEYTGDAPDAMRIKAERVIGYAAAQGISLVECIEALTPKPDTHPEHYR